MDHVTNDPGHDNLAPAWSPDGAKIVFNSTRDSGQGEIYAMDADGATDVRAGRVRRSRVVRAPRCWR